jgi:hypothetical protein
MSPRDRQDVYHGCSYTTGDTCMSSKRRPSRPVANSLSVTWLRLIDVIQEHPKAPHDSIRPQDPEDMGIFLGTMNTMKQESLASWHQSTNQRCIMSSLLPFPVTPVVSCSRIWIVRPRTDNGIRK